MSVNKISKTTNAVKSAILRKSVRTLPNNPSAKGYKAEEIKQAMYEFVTGESNSVMNEQDRIVGEINTAIDEINESFEQRDNNLSSHSSRKDNPHAVTATQIGLGNVNNTSDKDKPISNATQQELNKKVNKSDVIDNLTSDNADKPVSAKQAKNLKGLVDALDEEVKKKANAELMNQQLATKINASEKGATNGVAMLGDDGKVPVSQLPMSVLEQIIELVDFSDSAPKVGANGEQYYNSTYKKIYTSNGTAWIGGETPLASKIYSVIAGANANKQYRWSGLDLVNIGSPLALGETSVNAYPGDKGKLAYEHSLKTSGNPHGVTKEDIGLGNVSNKKEEALEVLSAKTLTNSVMINGVSFNGSQDIEILDNTKVAKLSEELTPGETPVPSYNKDGLIVGGRELQDEDIPEVIARKNYVDGIETTLKSELNNKLNKNLGAGNALKMLVTDKEGNISVNDMPEGTDITEDLTGLVNQNDDTLKKIASSAYMAKELNVKIETAKTNLGEDISNLETELGITNDNLQGAVNRIAGDEEIIEQNTNARHTHSNKDILDKTTASFTVADRQKLDGIDPEADDITIDSSLSSTSTNPIANQAVTLELNKKISFEETSIVDNSINPLLDYYNKSQINNLLSNPNLLINGDFSVNQRGQTSYSTANAYTVDRWKIRAGSNIIFDVATKKITYSLAYSILMQQVEDYERLKGKTITFSVKCTEVSGTVRLNIYSSSSHGVKVITSAGITEVTATIPTNISSLSFMIECASASGSITMEYAKVEIGSVATAFSPRPYAEELALCQRYYQINKFYKVARTVYTYYEPYVKFSVPMRVNPTSKTYAISESGVISANENTVYNIDNKTETAITVAPIGYSSIGGVVVSNGNGTLLTNNNYHGQVVSDAEIY